MKNLYSHLDLDLVTDDVNVIRRAMLACPDPETVREAKHILLHEKRKQSYDRVHDLLTVIGQLRSQLSLPPSRQWDDLGTQDFDDSNAGPFGSFTDILDDLDIGESPTTSTQLHGKDYSLFVNPKQIAIISAATAIVCILTIIVYSIVSASKPLPVNGFVDRFDQQEPDCQLNISNNSRDHAVVVFVTETDQQDVFSVFVHAGLTTTVGVPGGSYEVRYSVGESFLPPSRHLAPTKGVRVGNGGTLSIAIPGD